MFAHRSTLELMKQSKPFKIMACVSVLFFLVGLLLNILYASGACYHHHRKCTGLSIAGGVLLGLSVISAVLTIVIFRRLKQQYELEIRRMGALRYRMEQQQQQTSARVYRPPMPPVQRVQPQPQQRLIREVREDCHLALNPTIATQ